MRSTYLIAGAVVLALVVAGVLFGTDFFSKNPLSGGSPDTGSNQFATVLNDVAAAGGFVASFSEADSRKWVLAGGHRLERFSLNSTGGVFARLTSKSPLDRAPTRWESQGLSVTLPIEFAQRFAGHRIQIGIIARSPSETGSGELHAVYATQQAGNSGWNVMRLSNDFQVHIFEWFVRQVDGGYQSHPIVVIHGDAQGSGRPVELIGVYIKVVE